MATQIATPAVDAPPIFCPSKKKVFYSEAEAVSFETTNRAKYNLQRQHAYKCDQCPAYHLTTMAVGEHIGNEVHRTTASHATFSANHSVSGREAQARQISDLRRKGQSNNDICATMGISYMELLQVQNWCLHNDFPLPPSQTPQGRQSGAVLGHASARARKAKVVELFKAGQSYESIRQIMLAEGSTESLIYGDYTAAKTALAPKKNVSTPVSVTLDAVSEKRKALEAELAALQRKENELLEAKRTKVKYCWDGKGVLIQKEANMFAIGLADVPELIELLEEIITREPVNNAAQD